MKLSLQKDAKLAGEYTNHSIRATVISTLDDDGFESRHIMSLSSHKEEACIKEYATKCPEKKRKEMFDSLANKIQTNPKKIKTVTVSKPTENKDLPPTFDIEPIDDFDTIDNKVLRDLLLDPNAMMTDDSNQNFNNNNDSIAVSQANNPNQTINRQINTVNQPINRFPHMYFPNSNVTINYNIIKK